MVSADSLRPRRFVPAKLATIRTWLRLLSIELAREFGLTLLVRGNYRAAMEIVADSSASLQTHRISEVIGRLK